MNTTDYLQGIRDAKEGLPAEVCASDDYYAGYSTQYEAEQIITELNFNQDRLMSIFG